jgi:DNA-directed RNA polymerase beta' subunit
LVGKKGRIRHNILGKRTDFSSRAVITPNPKIDINYLSLGVKIFLTNTTSLTINKLNEKEYNRFRAVYKTYPNIIYITKKERNTKYCLGRLKKNDFLFPEVLILLISH